MRKRWLVILLMAITVACSKQEVKESPAFTLMTGVKVVGVSPCTDEPRHGLSIKKEASSYLVAVTGSFSCEVELKAPYLTLTREKRATLVADADVNKSSCECFRTKTVSVTERLESGDTLYGLNNGEVVGHTLLP